MNKVLSIFFIIIFLTLTENSFSQDSIKRRPKVGLVLSGGGAKGFAHVGVLKVLEEANIPIDYIGGTSMGAIVGALYAIGYDAESLEKIVSKIDWEELLTDKTARNTLTIQEKEQDSKYFLTFPIDGHKIKLPEGIIAGQNISKVLNRLCYPVKNQHDFKKFDIPFLAIAADIETGESVTLDKGNLPDVLRASMSIPSAFNPVELDGRLLVDGGLLNNLPVEEVLNMGADIIIAIDMQEKFFTKDELKSVVKILQQSGKFLRAPANVKNRKLANILIQPDVEKYNVTSFKARDTLISIGEKALRDALPQIIKLTGVMPVKNKRSLHFSENQNDTIFITDVYVHGLKHVSNIMSMGKLHIDLPAKMTLKEIEAAVDRLYGSQYFERVTYHIDPIANGNRIVFEVDEKTDNMMRLGLHYDSDNNASILLNTTVHNFYKNGSSLWVDLRMSKNPQFTVSYFIDHGWHPSLFFNLKLDNYEIDQYEETQRVATFNYSEMNFDLGFQSIISNAFSLGLGAQSELSSLRSKISPINFTQIDNNNINYFAFLKLDTYDRSIYPTKGTQLSIEFSAITDWESYDQPKKINVGYRILAKQNNAIKFTNKFSIISQLTLASSIQDSVSYSNRFYIGGIANNYAKGVLPFVGMNIMEQYGNNAFIARFDGQYQFLDNHFLTLKYNFGQATQNWKDLFDTNKFVQGAGITYGYNSIFGPIELTLMSSTHDVKLLIFLNAGFWF